MLGDFWENVDWDKFYNIAHERAMKDLEDRLFKYEIEITDASQMEEYIKKRIEENYIYLVQRIRYHQDNLWLMGPVPMKKGYEPPTIDGSWLL